jgi:hypothetical protein
MKHHAWASKQRIALVALALAFAPAGKAAKSPSRFHLDGKTGSTERVSAPPVPSDANSGAQEAARQTPAPPTVAGQPTVKRPLVTYEDGELTIIAENSSLSEVMKALRSSLGADIDLPANVNDQQVWVRLGPGPARRVLRDLLDGTEFNYVIQASETDPDGIRSVLLTPKSTGAETGPAAKPGVRWMPGHAPDAANMIDSPTPPPEPVASPVASSDPSQATPAASPAAPPADASSSSARVQNTPASFEPISPRPAPATDPNEQIQQLQTLYQQRRQMQMQQNQRPAVQNQ